jgi:hypothetical protein
MRTLQTAAVVVVVFGFFALQASATPLGQLDYEGESSAQAATAGSAIAANVSDLLTFDVSVDVDSSGLATISFEQTAAPTSSIGIDAVDDWDVTLASATWEINKLFTSFARTTGIVILESAASVLVYDAEQIDDIGFVGAVSLDSITMPDGLSDAAVSGAVGTSTPTSGLAPTAPDGSPASGTPDLSPSFSINTLSGPVLAAVGGIGVLALWLVLRRRGNRRLEHDPRK